MRLPNTLGSWSLTVLGFLMFLLFVSKDPVLHNSSSTSARQSQIVDDDDDDSIPNSDLQWKSSKSSKSDKVSSGPGFFHFIQKLCFWLLPAFFCSFAAGV